MHDASGVLPPSKKPVVSESYDEFVFVKPNPAFAEQLSAATTKFEGHPLQSHFHNNAIVEESAKEGENLQTIQSTVTRSIEELRRRLFQVEREINALKQLSG